MLLMTVGAVSASAAASAAECGQLTGYTAPDPAGPTDGSLQLGYGDPWVVLATADVGPAAEVILPSLVNAGPTCVTIDVDPDGAISALEIAGSGTLRGRVDFDSGSGFYTFADRLIVPTFITDAVPGLAALFVTSQQAGSELTITFTVDISSGTFSGFDGRTAFCGAGAVTKDGDGQVGKAVIAAAVLTNKNLAALDGAGARRVCAAIHSVGTIDNATGAIASDTDVTIDVATAGATVTAPPTSIEASTTLARETVPGALWFALVFLGGLIVLSRRFARR